MSKHVHADMICAKAMNQELVKLVYCCVSKLWVVSHSEEFLIQGKYFLCTEKHKEACLHYLNGGDVVLSSTMLGRGSERIIENEEVLPWTLLSIFCDDDYNIIAYVAPKKEKRWVVYNGKGEFINSLKAEPMGKNIDRQIFEIEIEIK